MQLTPIRAVRALLCACLILFLAGSSLPDTRPLPQDQGAAHLYQLLAKLKTTGRLMQVVAHPDDEDGGMLTLQARGKGVTTLLFTVTRGEGGQNKFGAESSDELGILRTLELLQADKYYGVEQRFSRVVDFGFSKTAEETFNKWHGHDMALADVVRAVRTFRPDVLTSRFSGTTRDGHGNHEASGVLTREAFRAAADPNRFPEQIKEGLLPWQARKLYLGAGRGGNIADEDYTLKLDTGEYSPILGMSYAQFGLEGLAHQTSQGTGGIRVPPGHRYTYYKLMDSEPARPAGHENDFFDGIDTSLVGLAARLGSEESKVPFLRPALQSLQKHVDEASKLFTMREPGACAPPLLAGREEIVALIAKAEGSQLSAAAKGALLTSLRTKKDEFEQAANEALGVFFEVTVDQPGGPSAPSYFPRMEQTLSVAVPGQAFTVTTRLYNRGKAAIVAGPDRVDVPEGWKAELTGAKEPQPLLREGDAFTRQFRIVVPENARFTRPYFARQDPQEETFYKINDSKLVTAPFPAYPVQVTANFSVASGPGTATDASKAGPSSEAHAIAKVKFIDPALGQSERPLAVGPPVSVLLNTPVLVAPVGDQTRSRLEVSVRSNAEKPMHANLRLETPPGWSVEPESLPVNLDHDGDLNNYEFHIRMPQLREGKYQVTARVDYEGKQYTEGFKVISRPDLDSYYAYNPAVQTVRAVDVKLPQHLKIGYVMGAGDEILPVMETLGLDVKTIGAQELVYGDLSQYDTIVVGIRAYDVRTDIREKNRRLLDYVRQGGTLIVQYNQSTGLFNEGHYTPFPTTAGNARVSVEEQPVEILAPEEHIFSYPNKINAKDFDGWVQERGLYFMTQWDPQFKPLLASSDPGEQPQKGGLLLAHYGKGTYIYCGYAFFRQLPAGVPGAVRLFVNLLSTGHDAQPGGGVRSSQ